MRASIAYPNIVAKVSISEQFGGTQPQNFALASASVCVLCIISEEIE